MARGTDLGRVMIVLVDPKEAGNVGSAARAMKTMGLSRLALVRGPELDDPDARRMAHGAHDILEAAERHATFPGALAECRWTLATTHRRRRGGPQPHPVEEAVPALLDAARDGPVALVFGREDRGLTAAELALCGGLCRLPAVTTHPSLNLAMAVMVFSWELARVARMRGAGPDRAGRTPGARRRAATMAERAGLLEEWQALLAPDLRLRAPDSRLVASLRLLLLGDTLDRTQLGTLRRLVRTLSRTGDVKS